MELYRQALALPGLRSLMLVSTLARVPVAVTGVVLTLYVVLGLERGYGAAGLVGTATTLGSALGGPLLGRLVDRRGLRPTLALTTAASAVFWWVAPTLTYPVLVVAAFLGGLFSLPIFSVTRQSIAAIVPEDRRRQAYALDSMSVELAFIVGPTLAVLLATTTSPRVTFCVIGAGLVASGLALLLLNPATGGTDEPTGRSRPVPRREWLTPRLLGVLALTAASTVVISGTDVAIVAVLRAGDGVQWTGLVLAIWSVASLVGGFAYGAVSRPLPPVVSMALLSLCTIPVGLAGHWWLLCLALVPAGLLCAPTLAAAADAVSRLAPVGVRGEAMGMHGSALTVGVALGAPLAGAVIDASVPALGFAATGLVGALVALVALPGELRRRRVEASVPATDPATHDAPVTVDAGREP